MGALRDVINMNVWVPYELCQICMYGCLKRCTKYECMGALRDVINMNVWVPFELCQI